MYFICRELINGDDDGAGEADDELEVKVDEEQELFIR